jgi:hypothetical protein
MINRSLLKQVLKFRNSNPTNGSVSKLYSLVNKYEEEHAVFIIDSRTGKRAEIVNYVAFFEFISDVVGSKIESFDQIERILNAETREEQSKETGNTKTRYIEVFDKTIIFQTKDNSPIVYKEHPNINEDEIILAVENGETFLNIYNKMSKYGFDKFVYLGGYSNTATRNFLEDKNVVFYLDYDIEAIRIFKSFKCKSKKIFMHPEIEEYFINTKSNELYLKQRKNMPDKNSIDNDLLPLWNLINKYSAVVEQEEIS